MSAFTDQYRLLHERDFLMDHIKSYLLSIIAAAVICAIINTLFANKTGYGGLIKLLCGIFLTVTIVAPWKRFRFDSFTAFKDELSNAANIAVDNGVEYSKQAVCEIIKAKTEAYILDKASSMGMNIDVEVTLNNADLPLPQKVTIQGAVSPYAKERLSKCIVNELDIPEDELIWI